MGDLLNQPESVRSEILANIGTYMKVKRSPRRLVRAMRFLNNAKIIHSFYKKIKTKLQKASEFM